MYYTKKTYQLANAFSIKEQATQKTGLLAVDLQMNINLSKPSGNFTYCQV
jgi:hypothetical protein